MPKKFIAFAGPRHFTFVDPDTGFPYWGATKEELYQRIVTYREQNKLPPILHLWPVIENYLCGLPENCGQCEEVKFRRGWYQTIRGGVALLENFFYGKANMVSDATANLRAEICINCPNNVFPDTGGFVGWSDEVAEMSTGGRKSIHHDKLGECSSCGCCLRAKVFYKGTIVLTKEEKASMPNFCWQIPLSENTK